MHYYCLACEPLDDHILYAGTPLVHAPDCPNDLDREVLSLEDWFRVPLPGEEEQPIAGIVANDPFVDADLRVDVEPRFPGEPEYPYDDFFNWELWEKHHENREPSSPGAHVHIKLEDVDGDASVALHARDDEPHALDEANPVKKEERAEEDMTNSGCDGAVPKREQSVNPAVKDEPSEDEPRYELRNPTVKDEPRYELRSGPTGKRINTPSRKKPDGGSDGPGGKGSSSSAGAAAANGAFLERLSEYLSDYYLYTQLVLHAPVTGAAKLPAVNFSGVLELVNTFLGRPDEAVFECGGTGNPGSTIQILGAERALFRALKTKGATPKYGLLYQSTFIGRAGPKIKGRIPRYLANKYSIASRIDNFSEQGQDGLSAEQSASQVRKLRLRWYLPGYPPANSPWKGLVKVAQKQWHVQVGRAPPVPTLRVMDDGEKKVSAEEYLESWKDKSFSKEQLTLGFGSSFCTHCRHTRWHWTR
ncbi:putative snoRNA binding domain-containing protein [Cercophora scortea]|uniref:SnoRNA binding domain-containing protein n=1 Tax=Cercophora scortea TaxID=314031 RepID=A0AAE0M5N2_9PEZI|nr:putative snoRNA binding domain-containing protein [Cercophora scortea]